MAASYPPAPTDIHMNVIEECVAELFVVVFGITSNPSQTAETVVARIRKRRDEYLQEQPHRMEGVCKPT